MVISFSIIFVYILELGTIDWMCKYLVEVKRDSVTSAGFKMSFLPLFGIVGYCAIEYSSKKVASTVVGFIGAFGYVGGFLSSNLTGIISDKLGWVFIPILDHI